MLNVEKLKLAEFEFLRRFPGGFAHPDMQVISKKHNVAKIVTFAQKSFTKKASKDVDCYAENMIKVVSRSSMVSMFEKPKFRDFVRHLDPSEKAFLVKSMHQMLQGKQQFGFDAMLELLKNEKLAKWSLMSIILFYYGPNTEVFVKPTITKNVINYFDVEGLVYKPTPSWDFYRQYRSIINDAKTKVDSSLSPSNAAFTGFLMMAMPSQ